MARDGEIMKKVFDSLYNDSDIQSYYLEASRRTFFFASMEHLDDEVLDYFIEGALGTTFRNFIIQFQLEGLEEKAVDFFDDLDIQITTSRDRQLLKKFFIEVEIFFLDQVSIEKQN